MVCPKCQSYNVSVGNTRTTKYNTVSRQRICSDCKLSFKTYEISHAEIKRINKMYDHIEKFKMIMED